MNTTVTFEIAKLLKEKEFDKICYKAFLFRTYQPSNIYEENIETIKNAENYSNSEYKKYYRPTIAGVIMWIYETHNIWINVSIDDENHINWHIRSGKYSQIDVGFKTPTEAYLAAIIFVLTELIK